MSDFFSDMSIVPREFENVLFGMFGYYGYTIEPQQYNNAYVAHFHLRINKSHECALVRYKCWSIMRNVDLSDVTSFSYTMDNEHANAGFYITLGEFDDDAYDFAKQNRIALINRSGLYMMLVETNKIPKRRDPTFRKL